MEQFIDFQLPEIVFSLCGVTVLLFVMLIIKPAPSVTWRRPPRTPVLQEECRVVRVEWIEKEPSSVSFSFSRPSSVVAQSRN